MNEIKVSLLDMVMSISNIMDLISPALAGHHKRVAQISLSIANEMKLPEDEKNALFIAALLHDCGALSLKERLDALKFELEYPHNHSIMGYLLLKDFSPLQQAAQYIRYHHVAWNYGEGAHSGMEPIPLASHILHLSDRIDVLVNKEKEVIGQTEGICEKIKQGNLRMFHPELVEVFLALAEREAFWLDMVYLPGLTYPGGGYGNLKLDMDGILDITKVFERIIDFRSRFTATHSNGVAAVAEALASYFEYSADECKLFRAAGYLHDLGKLSVPVEILEKKDKLTKEEVNIIKCHTYVSYSVLSNIKGFERIRDYACFHHERLNGKGYPFHLKEDQLSRGARILCVADIFTAITEDRPYRRGMGSTQAMNILQGMVNHHEIDASVVSRLGDVFDSINQIRIEAQRRAEKDYEDFLTMYDVKLGH